MATWTEFEALLLNAGFSIWQFGGRYGISTGRVYRWKDRNEVPRWAIESLKGYIAARRIHGDAWK